MNGHGHNRTATDETREHGRSHGDGDMRIGPGASTAVDVADPLPLGSTQVAVRSPLQRAWDEAERIRLARPRRLDSMPSVHTITMHTAEAQVTLP